MYPDELELRDEFFRLDDDDEEEEEEEEEDALDVDARTGLCREKESKLTTSAGFPWSSASVLFCCAASADTEFSVACLFLDGSGPVDTDADSDSVPLGIAAAGTASGLNTAWV